MSKHLSRILTPIFLLAVMLIDGQFTEFLSTDIFKNQVHPVSHIFLIILMYIVLKNSYIYNVSISLLIGLIYDSYYLGILGIATLIYPLIALFIYSIRDIIHTNRITKLFTIIIIVTIFELGSTLMVMIFGLAKVDLVDYIAKSLAPTLLLNIILWLILQFPLEKIYKD